VGTAQGVFDGLAGGLGVGDLLVEFGQFAPLEPPPLVGATPRKPASAFCSASENPASRWSRMTPPCATADSG
jgi:hypothetical protein